MSEKITSRRKRSDAGKVQLTERDLRVMTWIADQYAARTDQVRELLSPADSLISETRLRQILARWSAGGWIASRRWLADEPLWIWITSAGLRLLGLDELYSPMVPAATRLHHIYAVNEVRAYIERRTSPEKPRSWRSERTLRAGLDSSKKGRKIGPLPDGEVLYSGHRVAIEVELSTKKREDLVSKLARLCYKDGDGYNQQGRRQPYYNAIWMFVPTLALQARIEEAKKKLNEDAAARVMTYIIEVESSRPWSSSSLS